MLSNLSLSWLDGCRGRVEQVGDVKLLRERRRLLNPHNSRIQPYPASSRSSGPCPAQVKQDIARVGEDCLCKRQHLGGVRRKARVIKWTRGLLGSQGTSASKTWNGSIVVFLHLLKNGSRPYVGLDTPGRGGPEHSGDNLQQKPSSVHNQPLGG